MWKPGTTKPDNGSSKRTTERRTAASERPRTEKVVKTKLSGATMGMRFMQRSAEANPATTKAVAMKTEHDDEKMKWAEDSQILGDDHVIEDDVAVGATSSQESRIATASDMYGLKSDLVGRRSFGGFNKSVEQSWKSALSVWKKGRRGDKAEKEQISDEELLRRYEDYVKGHGDMVDSHIDPVGGLGKKLKRRKTKA